MNSMTSVTRGTGDTCPTSKATVVGDGGEGSEADLLMAALDVADANNLTYVGGYPFATGNSVTTVTYAVTYLLC